jgi:hypothetical protein
VEAPTIEPLSAAKTLVGVLSMENPTYLRALIPSQTL